MMQIIWFSLQFGLSFTSWFEQDIIHQNLQPLKLKEFAHSMETDLILAFGWKASLRKNQIQYWSFYLCSFCWFLHIWCEFLKDQRVFTQILYKILIVYSMQFGMYWLRSLLLVMVNTGLSRLGESYLDL